MRMVFLLTVIVTAKCAEPAFGTWKVNANRSTFTGGAAPRSLTVRIEPHAKGEVFTLERVEKDGRATSSSTILYFDNTPRDLQDFDCVGAQSSRRLDGRTIEIRRDCAGSTGIWVVRRQTDKSKELIIDITEKRRSGPNLDWRLVLEKQ
jgi:hypothetical protein